MTATGADVEALLASVGVPPAPEVPVRLEGHDPVLASPFPVGEASAAALAACGAMAARLWLDRTGEAQDRPEWLPR